MSDHTQILVVDDDKEDQLILLDYFREAGIDKLIHFAENGVKAKEFLERITGDEDLPSLVVLDLNMPILNGTQTLQWMKQTARYKDIPVIIFSTSENEMEKRRCLNSGAVDYMVKPSTYDEGEMMVKKFSSYINL